jgi:hypothetical protein
VRGSPLADLAQSPPNLFVGRGLSGLIWKFECRAMAIPIKGETPARRNAPARYQQRVPPLGVREAWSSAQVEGGKGVARSIRTRH